MSLDIWTSRTAFSRDARRASKVLAVMLSKVPKPAYSSSLMNTLLEMPCAPQVSANGEIDRGTAANPSVNSSWDRNGFNAPGQGFFVQDYDPTDFDFADPLNTIFNEPNDIDWVSRSRSTVS